MNTFLNLSRRRAGITLGLLVIPAAIGLSNLMPVEAQSSYTCRGRAAKRLAEIRAKAKGNGDDADATVRP